MATERPLQTFDAAAYVEAAAAMIGLAVPESSKDGVVANLVRLHGFAALLVDFEPALALDPAPVFRILPEK